MIKPAMRWLGLLLMLSGMGCIYIPMWRVSTPKPCQWAEDRWGDAVDGICNRSPVDRPCHDPHYHKQGVYRIAPGLPSSDVSESEYEAEDENKVEGEVDEDAIPPLPMEENPEEYLKP